MPEVRFLRRCDGRTEELRLRVAEGTPLLEAARAAGLPVAQACGGDRLCGRCALVVVQDADALSPESADEVRAKARNRVPPEARLACEARIQGDLTATAPYW